MKKFLSLFLIITVTLAISLVFISCSCNGNQNNNEEQGIQGEPGRDVLKVQVIDGCLWFTYKDAPNNPVNGGRLYEDGAIIDWTTELEFYPLNDGTYGVNGEKTQSLSDIIIPEKLNKKVVSAIMPQGFKDCSNLKSIFIPNSIKSVGGGAFENCSVTEVSCPVDVISSLPKATVKKVVLNGGTDLTANNFVSFDALETLEIASTVTSISGNAFIGCVSLTDITVKEGNPHYKSIDGNLYSVDDKAIIRYAPGKQNETFEIPNTLETIGEYAFEGCNSLKSIILPNSVTIIEKCAFKDCKNISSIEISNSTKIIRENAFENCGIVNATIPLSFISSMPYDTLKNVVITSGEKILKRTFSYFENLETINIPSSVTEIESGAFYNCSYIKSITVDENNQNYKIIDGCLYTKDVTTLVVYLNTKEDAVFEVPNTVTNICTSAFYNCTNLTSVKLPNGLVSIDEFAFEECKNLTSVNIPSSVVNIANGAFVVCENLTIYCESESIPSTWCEHWNPDNRPVELGSKSE